GQLVRHDPTLSHPTGRRRRPLGLEVTSLALMHRAGLSSRRAPDLLVRGATVARAGAAIALVVHAPAAELGRVLRLERRTAGAGAEASRPLMVHALASELRCVRGLQDRAARVRAVASRPLMIHALAAKLRGVRGLQNRATRARAVT